jgi:SinI restriction endonuclease.
MMTIEGMVGNLLEEYLATILHPYGWYCCWGSTIDAVDFCKEDGSLLQVKTSNNSENSSSIRVRNGTEIRIWFRRFFNKANTFNWVALNEIIGRDIFNEEDSERKFRDFITRTIRENPGCIYIPEKCHIEAVQMELW